MGSRASYIYNTPETRQILQEKLEFPLGSPREAPGRGEAVLPEAELHLLRSRMEYEQLSKGAHTLQAVAWDGRTIRSARFRGLARSLLCLETSGIQGTQKGPRMGNHMKWLKSAWVERFNTNEKSILRFTFRPGTACPWWLGWTGAVLLLAMATPLGAAEHVPGQLLVKPRHGVPERTVQATFRNQGAVQVGAIGPINVRILRVPDSAHNRVLAALKSNRNVEFAEPDYVLEPTLVPNDPYYSLQWHLPRIQAPEAWDYSTGLGSVTIAVLDSGVDSTHPDLGSQIVSGWNFFDDNADTSDATGHGTGVAGNACAAANNSLGIASPAWGCKIMPIRVSDNNGYATSSMLAAGLTYAADHGARVANASFQIIANSTLTKAEEYFYARGGVFTSAAGNDGLFNASPDDPYAIRVSATDSQDAIASFSSTGNNVDLCAPGVNIATTTRGGGYGYATGTSASAPLVAGVAALLLSVNPALSPTDVQRILIQSADDLGDPGWDPIYGWGRLNARQAVLAALKSLEGEDVTPPQAQILTPGNGSVVNGTVAIEVDASDNVSVTSVDLTLNGIAVASSTTVPAVFSWDTTKSANGTYTLQAQAFDAAGNTGSSESTTVTVDNPVADTTAPTALLNSPFNGSTEAGTINVTVSASDNIGVTKVEWYLDGVLQGGSSDASASFSWDTTSVPNGAHALQAKAYDAAGNVGVSAIVTMTVQNTIADTTAPTVTITSPISGAKVTKNVKVSVVASDNLGVTKVDLLVDGKLYSSSTSASPTFSWNTSKLSRGSHTLQAVAWDAAGNSGRSIVVTVQK